MDTNKRIRSLIILIALSIISGCATNYLYTSKGSFEYSTGEQRQAVLYWRADEGRTWYLAPYNEPDSGASLSVCGSATDNDFVPIDSSSTHHLITKSRAMDARVGNITSEGEIMMLDSPVRLRDGSECGRILLGNEPANIKELKEGEVIKIAFYCKNDMRVDRYPVPKVYVFNAIKKAKTEAGEGKAPDPCISVAK